MHLFYVCVSLFLKGIFTEVLEHPLLVSADHADQSNAQVEGSDVYKD